MKQQKLLALFILFAMFLTIVHSMARWDDTLVKYDNICYLRQAHLFQRFGLGGLDTDLRKDDDGYFAEKLVANHVPPTLIPCHPFFAALGKTIMQYPPGPGFVLSLFPAGIQIATLYISCTAIVFLLIGAGVFSARSPSVVWTLCFVGLITLYLMINPPKYSASLPLTLVLCFACAYLTPVMFGLKNRAAAVLIAGCIGFLLGLSVDMRIANLFLTGGFFVYFGLELLMPGLRRPDALLRGFVFGFCALVGLTPTLVANAINVGSPFVTTYGTADAIPPEFGIILAARIFFYYMGGNSGLMLALALVGTIFFREICGTSGIAKRTYIVVIANLLINMSFYLTHNSTAPYYLQALGTLTVWTVLFCYARVTPTKKWELNPISAT